MNKDNHDFEGFEIDEVPVRKPRGSGNRIVLYVVIAIAAVALGVGAWMAYDAASHNSELEELQAKLEQQQLDMEQMQLEQDYEDLNREFAQFENSRQLIQDDSVKRVLAEKYEAARLQVEQLQNELNSEKRKSSAEIAKLKSEIETLRALLRHYVEEIDRLNKENEALRSENQEIKSQNERLNSQVAETSRRNEVLSERMTLAEKLNVTGLSLTPLNKKGKKEKKVAKATQLMVSSTSRGRGGHIHAHNIAQRPVARGRRLVQFRRRHRALHRQAYHRVCRRGNRWRHHLLGREHGAHSRRLHRGALCRQFPPRAPQLHS